MKPILSLLLTAGHGTTGQAKFWAADLGRLLQSAPRRGQ